MIFHASMPADILRMSPAFSRKSGAVLPLLSVLPDSWMAVAGDERGTIIETYPCDRVITPGAGSDSFMPGDAQDSSHYSAFHMAVGTL
jgi:hypothetical protein